MPTQYQKPDQGVIAQAVEVWGEGPEISPYPDAVDVDYEVGVTGIPRGGVTTQVLTKLSNLDYDVGWVNPTYLVTKSTPPVAADYGLTVIPIGAVWIQS